jgi:peptide/nickel transport system permease protein
MIRFRKKLFKKLSERSSNDDKIRDIATASQWKLIYWKFLQHKMAIAAIVVLLMFYVAAIFAGFFAVNDINTRFANMQNTPPMKLHLFSDRGFEGPFYYANTRQLNMATYRYEYTPDTTKIIRVRLLGKGFNYKLFGFFPASRHLLTSENGEIPLLLLGTDGLGRCLFSRIIYGSQISLSIGLVGVFISFVIGVFVGSISGYFGGIVDEVIQRIIDFIVSIPTMPLWMVLSAAIPRDWPVTRTYFMITIILSLVGWCSLARVVRGKLLALREEDFVAAARAAGAGHIRIITRHLLPSFSSHLIVSITLSVPRMILSETSLSFLGLGMQPPAVSWGVLLQDAQNLLAIASYPWQLTPAFFIIVVVLMYNFFGDGLRDAVDPYGVKH